jgi:hypothetical protein
VGASCSPLWQLGNEAAGIAQGAQFAAVGQWDRIAEGALSAFVRHQSLIHFSTRVCLCPDSGGNSRHPSTAVWGHFQTHAMQRQLGVASSPRDLASLGLIAE